MTEDLAKRVAAYKAVDNHVKVCTYYLCIEMTCINQNYIDITTEWTYCGHRQRDHNKTRHPSHQTKPIGRQVYRH